MAETHAPQKEPSFAEDVTSVDAEPTAAPAAGAEAVRFSLRTAGYCLACDRIVERDRTGMCINGHSAELVTGSIQLAEGEGPPSLPRFSISAFAMPPVWGPLHGLWVGVLFLPIWLFADSALSTFASGSLARIGAVVIAVTTLGFQVFFAKRANGLAWRRVAETVSVEEFTRRERRWAYLFVPLGVALLSWALYYRFVIA